MTPDELASRRPGMLKSAGVLSAAIAASRVTGLMRESVLGWLFGASAAFDAYVLGFRIPMLTRELFAEGALSAAFIPTFSRYLATEGDEAARELSDITATLITVIVGTICVAGVLAAPLFVDLFAPGFHAVPGKWELAVTLVRIMFPFLLLVSLAAQAQGVLNANHQFGLPAISSSVFNIVSVTAGLAIGHYTQFGAMLGMAIGVLVGGVAQLGFHLPAIWRLGFLWRPRWNLKHPGVRHILLLMGPALIGSTASQVNTLVNTNLASSLRDASGHVMNGPVSWLSYAFRFMHVPTGVFAVAIASATLPHISRSAALQNWAEFRDSLSRSLTMILVLTLPSAAGLIVLGESMIALVYQRGRFLPSDTHQTALALGCYSLGLAGAAGLKLMAPAFYALGDARTPMLVGMCSILINAVTAYGMIHFAGLGHVSLALSSAAVSTFSALALIMLIRPRLGGLNGKALLDSFLRIALASFCTAAATYAVRQVVHRTTSGKTANWMDVGFGIPIGVVAFYLSAVALRVPELRQVKDSIMTKFGPLKKTE